jgi:hypothetical protein
MLRYFQLTAVLQVGRDACGAESVIANLRLNAPTRSARAATLARQESPERALPGNTESSVEGQETRDDRSLDVFAEDNLQHDRSLEHLWNRRPELGQRSA